MKDDSKVICITFCFAVVGWGLFGFWLVGCVGFLDGWLVWFLALFVCLFLVQKSSVSLFLWSKSGLYTGVCQFPGMFQSFYSVRFSDCIIFGLVGALTLYSICRWVKPATARIAHPLSMWVTGISAFLCRTADAFCRPYSHLRTPAVWQPPQGFAFSVITLLILNAREASVCLPAWWWDPSRWTMAVRHKSFTCQRQKYGLAQAGFLDHQFNVAPKFKREFC